MKMKKKLGSMLIVTTVILSGIPMYPHSAEAADTGEIQRSVNFRTGPSTGDSRIRYLQDGEQVTILEEVNRYWYKVRDSSGRVGYTSSNQKYINITENVESSATVVRSVSFRKGPSTSYSRMRYLRTGEKVSVIKEVNSYWLKVKDKHGNYGYVSSSEKYIELSGTTETQAPTAKQLTAVINAAKQYLGTPYEYGSNRSSTKTFDCSDLVRRAFIEGIGVTLPTNSRSQAEYVKEVGKTSNRWENLKPGDLMFFMSYKGTSKSAYSGINKTAQRITHVSLYLGNGKMLHTYSNSSGGVRIDTIDNRHWEYRFIFGGSAL
jgi:cell wall-associated NlpC family hydrolase